MTPFFNASKEAPNTTGAFFVYNRNMRKEQLRNYKSGYDNNLKLLKAKQVKLIKDKRAKFRKKQKNIIEKQKELVKGKRNYKATSNRQEKKYKKKIDKSIKLRQKYKYQNNKGDIALSKLYTNETNWIDSFASSNVYKFRRDKNNLDIMFLDGSVYKYFGVGKLFIGLLNTGSKGKWVWKNLRRHAVNYIKVI